jgi:hypothetical protein
VPEQDTPAAAQQARTRKAALARWKKKKVDRARRAKEAPAVRYPPRKRIADARPRVRGRFVKAATPTADKVTAASTAPPQPTTAATATTTATATAATAANAATSNTTGAAQGSLPPRAPTDTQLNKAAGSQVSPQRSSSHGLETPRVRQLVV